MELDRSDSAMDLRFVSLCSALCKGILWQIRSNQRMNGKLTQGGVLGAAVVLAVVAWQTGLLSSGSASDFDQNQKNALEKDGNEMLRQAAEQIRSGPSFEADVRHEFELYGIRRTAHGSFLERGKGSGQVRLQLKTTIDDQVATWLRVSDGRFVYSKIDLPDATRITRLDLGEMQRPLQAVWSRHDRAEGQSSSPRPELLAGEAAAQNSATATDELPEFATPAGFGSVAFLLARLDRDFEFSPPELVEIEKARMFKLVGRWRTESLSKMMVLLTGQPVDDKARAIELLPPHLPTTVEVILGADAPLELFPFQVRFLREEGAGGGKWFQSARAKQVELMNLEFQRVQFDVEFDDVLFTYEPGGEEVEYRTGEYREALETRFLESQSKE